MVLVRFCVDWKSIGRAKWSRLSLVMDGRRRARARSRGLEETRDSETGLIGSVTDRVGGKGGTERLKREVRPSPSRPKSDSLLNFMIPSSCELGQLDVLHGTQPSSGKKNKSGNFLVVVQLIHRLTQAEISCTIMARLFFSPLLEHNTFILESLASTSHSSRAASKSGRGRHFPRSLFHPLAVANLASRAARSDPTPLPTPSLNSG